jgi:hypothetical protein
VSHVAEFPSRKLPKEAPDLIQVVSDAGRQVFDIEFAIKGNRICPVAFHGMISVNDNWAMLPGLDSLWEKRRASFSEVVTLGVIKQLL